jgi:hypothetical protein
MNIIIRPLVKVQACDIAARACRIYGEQNEIVLCLLGRVCDSTVEVETAFEVPRTLDNEDWFTSKRIRGYMGMLHFISTEPVFRCHHEHKSCGLDVYW